MGDLYVLSRGEAAMQPRRADLEGLRLRQLAAGFSRSIAITDDGRIVSVTHTVDELSSLDGQLAQVAFGASHMAAVTLSGQVYSLGNNHHGQLGHGHRNSDMEPRLLVQLEGRNVVQVACGSKHSVALTAQGDVYCWGSGFDGQLGLGPVEVAQCPRCLHYLQGISIVQIAAGSQHAAALSADGIVYCWGQAVCGQLGCDRRSKCDVPTQVPDLPRIAAIACGVSHTVALSEAGEVFSWGMAAKGQPVSQCFQPEVFADDEQLGPFSQIVCGGDATVLLTASGEVLYWDPPRQSAPTLVEELKGLPVHLIATSGPAVLAFVQTCITEVLPTCMPLHGGSKLTLRGAGFFRSDSILLRFKHSGGAERLVRGTYSELGKGVAAERLVQMDVPSFEAEGAGDVAISLSFDGTRFCSPISVRCYEEPVLAEVQPPSAPCHGGTPMKLLVTNPNKLFSSPDAEARIFSESGALIASTPATFDAEANVMCLVLPAMSSVDLNASIHLALDGQSFPLSGLCVSVYEDPVFETPRPQWCRLAGGTKLKLAGSGLFPSADAAVRVRAKLPFFEGVAYPKPAEPAEEAPDMPVGDSCGDGTEPEVDTKEAFANEPTSAPIQVEPVLLDDDFEMVFKVLPHLSDGSSVQHTLPALRGEGSLEIAVALNGIDFVAVPGVVHIYGDLHLRAVAPLVGPRCGGTRLELRAEGLRSADELSVMFVKGALCTMVPASFDADRGCATCETPSWPPSGKEGEESDGDVVLELSLNGQQFTTACIHYLFQDSVLETIEPATGSLIGGETLKIGGQGLMLGKADPSLLRVRFTRTEPDEVMEVEAVLDEDGTLQCTAPAFEAPAGPFDAAVQVSLNGQQFPDNSIVYRYEGAPPKGKKK